MLKNIQYNPPTFLNSLKISLKHAWIQDTNALQKDITYIILFYRQKWETVKS